MSRSFFDASSLAFIFCSSDILFQLAMSFIFLPQDKQNRLSSFRRQAALQGLATVT
jgi:hypothetical protein